VTTQKRIELSRKETQGKDNTRPVRKILEESAQLDTKVGAKDKKKNKRKKKAQRIGPKPNT